MAIEVAVLAFDIGNFQHLMAVEPAPMAFQASGMATAGQKHSQAIVL